MGGSLGFGMSREGRARSETVVVRVGVEGSRVFEDRRWSWMEAVEGVTDGGGGRGDRRGHRMRGFCARPRPTPLLLAARYARKRRV